MRTVRLTLSPPGGTFHSVDRAIVESDDLSRESLTALDRLSDGSTIVLYELAAPSTAAIVAELESVETVVEFDVSRDDGTYTAFLHLEPEEPMSELLSVADRNALLIDRPLSFTDDGLGLRVVGRDNSLQSALADLPDDLGVQIDSTCNDMPGQGTLRTELTDRQREAIETAIDLGYYKAPRRATYEDIAEALDCAPSTANALLRRAEGTLVSAIFDP